MAEKKKAKLGKYLTSGAVIGLLVYFFNNGTGIGFLGNEKNREEHNTQNHIEKQQDEMTIDIIGESINVEGSVLTVEALSERLEKGQRVVLKSQEAKQLTYDSVKALLERLECVIIEE